MRVGDRHRASTGVDAHQARHQGTRAHVVMDVPEHLGSSRRRPRRQDVGLEAVAVNHVGIAAGNKSSSVSGRRPRAGAWKAPGVRSRAALEMSLPAGPPAPASPSRATAGGSGRISYRFHGARAAAEKSPSAGHDQLQAPIRPRLAHGAHEIEQRPLGAAHRAVGIEVKNFHATGLPAIQELAHLPNRQIGWREQKKLAQPSTGRDACPTIIDRQRRLSNLFRRLAALTACGR